MVKVCMVKVCMVKVVDKCMYTYMYRYIYYIYIQWSPSITDTIGSSC